jgi:hypothetical protein
MTRAKSNLMSGCRLSEGQIAQLTSVNPRLAVGIA